jgi:actin-like ATPase involved in cell morphogenesis
VAYRLAVDLGSSNTVAVVDGPDGQVRPLLFDGSELMPSAVCVDPSGALAVGRDAERLARADPAAYEPNPKRRVDDGTVLLAGHPVDVRDVLAAVLARVAAQAGPADDVVLTVPAGWGVPRRQVLADAAARAGLGHVTFVSEPIAAAAYFTGVLRHDLPPGSALAVVDLGGGTADLAVVRRGADGRLDVVAQAGLDVGGTDIDAAIVDRLGTVVGAAAPDVWRPLAAPSTPAERRDRLALWNEVRAAKESLSRLSVAPLHVPGYEVGSHLTRDELEAMAGPLLGPVGDLAANVAGGHPLAGVFLVGGGSRIPLLARLLHTRLGTAPTVVERPETVVAEGALLAVPWKEPAAEPEPPAPPRPVPKRRRRRWPTPAVLVLAILCFLLPFATVSCGLPDGYGRADTGGTTTYTGLDLAVGGTPDVRDEHVRPQAQRRPDRLPPQPLPLIGLLTAIAAAVTAVAVRPAARRRLTVAVIAAASALAVLGGQAVVVGLLSTRVRAQSALPAGKTAHDFVGTGLGFWLALALLVATAAGNVFALLRYRPATARDV